MGLFSGIAKAVGNAVEAAGRWVGSTAAAGAKLITQGADAAKQQYQQGVDDFNKNINESKEGWDETKEAARNFGLDALNFANEKLGGALEFLGIPYDSSLDDAVESLTNTATNTYNKYISSLDDAYSNLTNYWTGAQGASNAYNLAKRATGSITARQAESAANQAEIAQRASGVNKAQAAMGAGNIEDKYYQDTYEDNLKTQTGKVKDNINSYLDSQKSILEKEKNRAKTAYDEQLSIISSDPARAWADISHDDVRNSIAGNGYREDDWQGFFQSKGITMPKDLSSQVELMKKYGDEYEKWMKENQNITLFQDFYSDEELKNKEELTGPVIILFLIKTLRDYAHSCPNPTKEDKQIMANAIKTLQLYIELARREYGK